MKRIGQEHGSSQSNKLNHERSRDESSTFDMFFSREKKILPPCATVHQLLSDIARYSLAKCHEFPTTNTLGWRNTRGVFPLFPLRTSSPRGEFSLRSSITCVDCTDDDDNDENKASRTNTGNAFTPLVSCVSWENVKIHEKNGDKASGRATVWDACRPPGPLID